MDFLCDILPLKNVLFRTALRITLNREDAEDIVQDTLLKLWERRDTLSEVQNLEAFAIAAARNLALDRKELVHHKVISLNEEQHDQQDSQQLSAHENLVQEEKINHIHNLINQLPEKQRTSIQLREIEGKTYKEIAEIMGITEADVKINIYRGRNFLKNNCNFSAAEPSSL
ncbi:MAG: RNA polymerase sigma factor [Bacteroidaceae bacterium]|nr:RNA polymerase sigma factor [Bacteroidaceae bacterium]